MRVYYFICEFLDKRKQIETVQIEKLEVKQDLNDLVVTLNIGCTLYTRAAVVHLNFRAGSTFSVPVCIVSPGHWVNKVDT